MIKKISNKNAIDILTLYLRNKTNYEYATIYEIIHINQSINIEFRVSLFDDEHRIYELNEVDFKIWLRRKKLNKIMKK